MSTDTSIRTPAEAPPASLGALPIPHFDVIVVGAGLSGIGAAYRLQTECPHRSFVLLEGRARLGGTWDFFAYPGLRSDSDMYTLGYPFRPWTATKAIADGADILKYIQDTADAYGISPRIKYERRVTAAAWSSEHARWTLTVRGPASEELYTCAFLYLCSGYYSYESGHVPQFAGAADFPGPVVHPQQWPQDLDYRNKRVVVIGSGATAVTLVPALAREAAHVTMLQRSPSYISSLPDTDQVASVLRKVLPARAAHTLARWKNVVVAQGFYQFCKVFPNAATRLLKRGVRAEVGAAIDVDRHFTPKYKPWDQRLCLVPNADLFVALKEGKASIVTDGVRRFNAKGIELTSGEQLDADIIVTATGLKMVAYGGIKLHVDGAAIDPTETYIYKGLMFSGVPNFAWCIGYTNASWTLRADLASRYVCRLLNYLARQRLDFAVPERGSERMDSRPILDLSSGYVQRATSILPKQGNVEPWFLRQNFFRDTLTMRLSKLTANMRFGRARTPAVRHQAT